MHTKIPIPQSYGTIFVRPDEIITLKAFGSYTIITLKNNEEIKVSLNSKNMFYLLDGFDNFIRVHRSWIINKNYIKKIIHNKYKQSNLILLENGALIPIVLSAQKLLKM